jgi:hypothetical protein
MAVTAALSPSSFPQSSTGRLEVSRVPRVPVSHLGLLNLPFSCSSSASPPQPTLPNFPRPQVSSTPFFSFTYATPIRTSPELPHSKCLIFSYIFRDFP